MTPDEQVEALAEAVKRVTDLWDEPLDEVHDIPPIVNAILASPAFRALVAGERAAALREAAENVPWRADWTRGAMQGYLLERADRETP